MNIGPYPYNDVVTFDDFRGFVDGIAGYGDKTALVSYSPAGEELSYTYRHLADDVNALGAALCSMGLQNKHIAIVCENSKNWVLSLIAIASIGSVAVTVDIEQADEIIWKMVQRADAEAVIYSPTFKKLFAEKARTAGDSFIAISLEDNPPAHCKKFTDLIAYGYLQLGTNAFDPRSITIDRDQTAMIVYTSGTTSISKPVMLSHYNVQFNANHGYAMLEMGDKVFTSLPLYHTYGSVCGVVDILSQGKTMFINGDLKTMMRDLKLAGPDTIIVVPLIAEAMLARVRGEMKRRGMDAHPDYLGMLTKTPTKTTDAFYHAVRPIVDEFYGGRLTRLVSGGAHLGRDTLDQLNAIGIEVFQGYGITECSPLVSVNRNRANKLGTVGLLMPETQVKLVDGEFWVKGPSVAKGYYKEPELTREAFIDGWFRTGDTGSIDRQGFLSIGGRIKNLIIFKNGKKVTPEEIEGYVKDIPAIKEAMAYGATAGNSLDDVKLVLMVYPDPEATHGMTNCEVLQLLQTEIDKVNATLPSYKQIQTIKLRDTEFEKTATRKIKRYTV